MYEKAISAVSATDTVAAHVCAMSSPTAWGKRSVRARR